MSANVAEVMVEVLLEAGAKRCYGVVGDTINHLTDAIRRSDMEWVHVRHEEVGGFAAGGEACMTHHLSVCAGTCGPGSLHFVNGLFESHRNGAPVVFIASQVSTADMGVGFPQDVDQQKIFEQYSVFCETLVNPEQAQRLTAIAAQKALALGGVAVIIVPGDIFTQKPDTALPWRSHVFNPRVLPSEAELEAVAERINKGKKVAIYAGFGCHNAREQVLAVAKKLNAPVAWTSRAKDFIEYDNPYGVGMTGVFGLEGGFHALTKCDTLLLLGCSFAWTQFYPEEATIIQVDIDPGKIGLRHPIELGVVGSVRDTCATLVDKLEAKPDTAWLDKCRHLYQDALDKACQHSDKDTLIHPQELTYALDQMAAKDAVFTADGGSPMVWMLRHIFSHEHRRTLGSLLHGTMANAYPQALGIAKAYPQRQVIAMCGDGGLSMLLGDLLTLVQENIPVKIIVFNNASLGFVELEQKVEGLLSAFTDLVNPDFGAMAQTLGMWGRKIEYKHELEQGLRELLAQDGPALLDVKVNPVELVMPPKIEAGQVAGTTLYSAKAVLSGRMDEVVKLVKNNFLSP
ncbi:pyruvate oxidase [Oceanisphaera avium]|uniref:Pyruvate oxidase n=2 Tax=Oceanisphaera avium TaxID=1903694 RepID=A0A1Y0D085_9GAMM|nr:pyruvate oxidase [Oceanisphaera avium]